MLHGKHPCALSNKCFLKMCGNKHFLQYKLNFHLNSLLLTLFQHFSYNQITKQQLIIHHSQIKKVIYGFFPLHLTPKWCICCLRNLKNNPSLEDSGLYFHKAGIVGCHSNSSVRYNKVKFATRAVERGSIIQGPYTPTTTSKPARNQALLAVCSPCGVARVTAIFPPSHPWSHESSWQHCAEFPAW